jgi:hypothetical protein
MTKFCPHCQTRKPWSEFYAAAKHPDGSMVRPGAYCKPCVAARRRERRRMDPEWARAVYRADWQRIKADPEKLARRRELTRENKAVWRERRRPVSEKTEKATRENGEQA